MLSDMSSSPTDFMQTQGKHGTLRRPGPSCSKLTTSLVNDSLKFTSSDMQIF